MSIEIENPEVTPKDDENIKTLQDQIQKLESEKTNLVDEIKNDRTKRQELQDKIADLQKQIDNNNPPAPEISTENPIDISKAVADELARIKSKEAEDNSKKAFEQFIIENNIYSEDNDPAGLKAEALRKQLGRFNTTGIHSVEDFKSVIKDADKLLRQGDDNPVKTVDNPDDASLPTTGDGATPLKTTKLSDAEKRLLERSNMTEERFLELKQKQPGMIKDLLEQI